MKFRIYYEDGTTYASDPFYAASCGVVCVAQEKDTPTGWAIRSGRDYYYWKDERWYECDSGGLWDYLLMHTGPKAVLVGRYVRDDIFYDVMRRAQAEGIGE
jgi:hypothetical protein